MHPSMTIRLLATFAGLTLGLLSAQAFSTIAEPPVYTFFAESGDAASSLPGQTVSGGPWDGISGNIGDGDKKDVFYFGTPGGKVFIFFECGGSFGSCGDNFLATVFDSDQIAKFWTYPDNDPSAIELAAGNYYLVVEALNPLDPPFTVRLQDEFGTPGLVTAPVNAPVPATLALLGIGLAGLGFSRRRKVRG